ncbi:CarboxypepD_reg-like domain-containing protein [Zhouia amylolytica]|uniref:CarboxypepD_reg-like domain-containing protein n=1 Tax=Zhouia amylolytica TaxID=376730 RepID=A0A1I6URX1_9FLAO|nr:carboxypeptidase-like regulatory domain-containing protein [Zhouia amylolytica]SFT04209.1 CarboxypepD_reg-like domain-containing protein [Zhouia amylolytica]
MKPYYFAITLFLTCILPSSGQNSITARVIDTTSKQPIPFATITLNKNSGIISSESGNFTLHLNANITEHDSLYINCLGYSEKTLNISKFNDSIIFLSPKDIELNEVVLLNKNYTLEEIIEHVKDSLEINYDFDFLKQKLFIRNSYYTKIDKKDAKLTESSIAEFNQPFVDSLLNAIPNTSSNHSEVLGEFYSKLSEDNAPSKLDIIKASRLYDKNNEMSITAMTEKLQAIVRKHVKRDSYFKIKSGIIGTKTEIDSSLFGDNQINQTKEAIETRKKQEEARRKRFLHFKKQSLTQLQKHNFIFKDSDLNFIHKDHKYQFELENLTTLNDYIVYKVSFHPKGSADYQGTLYINADDFAVIRVDYQNVKPLKTFKLFGVSFNHYLNKGTLLYEKNTRNKYALKYAEEKEGQLVGFKRPVKIIEKNKNVKGRRKQNEVASDVDFIVRNTDKVEMIVFENTPINKSVFTDFKEKPNVKPHYLSKYDPEFWQGYNIIEPNKAIKTFKSLENE